MLTEYLLDRVAILEYARKWAFERNPAFYDFSNLGGDCTNFVSQCLYAGGAVMNGTPDTGWYYYSLDNRSPSWTGVEFFYDFLVNNRGVGPFGVEIPTEEVQPGDIIQLGRENRFYHSLLVVDKIDGMPYVAAHSKDVYRMPLYGYIYERSRGIHILGSRKFETDFPQ